MDLTIRPEAPEDRRAVEELAREAFWNHHVPGCDEHYLLHHIRSSADLIPQLNLVAVLDGRIVGHILYTRSWVVDKAGSRHGTLTFGPLSVHPDHQRRGIGKALIAHTRDLARGMGHRAIIIYGHPGNYCGSGFKSCAHYGITDAQGQYPSFLLVLELYPGALDGIAGVFAESIDFQVDPGGLEAFDRGFPPKEKAVTPGQEEFFINSHSFVQPDVQR